jgi:hypothetical protein
MKNRYSNPPRFQERRKQKEKKANTDPDNSNLLAVTKKRNKMKAKPEKSNLIGEDLPVYMGLLSCSPVELKNLRLAVMKMYLEK